MAASSSPASFYSDSTPRLILYVYFNSTQYPKQNKSTVTITDIRIGTNQSAGIGTWALQGTLTIGSISNSYYERDTSIAINSTGTQYSIGGSFGSFDVQHSSNGSGEFDVRWVGNFTARNTSTGTTTYWSSGTATLILPTIDRTGPTLTISATPSGTGEVVISGTASAASDNWYARYWKQGETEPSTWESLTAAQNGLSATGTFTGLENGDYYARIKARKVANEVEAQSSTASFNMDTPSVTVTVESVGPFSIGFKATSDVSCKNWSYSIDGGSTWTLYDQKSNTYSDTYTLTGLTADTSYTIRVKATKVSNNTQGIGSVTQKTYGPTKMTNVPSFELSVTSPSTSVSATCEYASFYYKLEIWDNAGSTLFGTLYPTISTAGNTSFTARLTTAIRDAILASISSAKTASLKFILYTYSNSARTTLVGTNTVTNISGTTTAAHCAPTFTTFTYMDNDSAITGVTQDNQTLVQNLSDLLVTIAAANRGTAKYQASISSYSITIGDVSMNAMSTSSGDLNIDVGAVTSSGSLALNVTCIDSRGYSTTATVTVNVLPYSSPAFSNFVLRRLNEIGATIQLTMSGSVSSIMPASTERNAVVYVGFKYKQSSGSTWTTVDLTSIVTVSGLSFSYQNLELMTLDENSTFDFVFYVRDNFGTLTQLEYEVTLTQGTPLMSFRKRTTLNNRPRVGINNPEPYYELDVHGDIAMHDVMVLGFVAELTTETLTTLTAGGYYTQADASEATSARGYPTVKAGLLEVLSNGDSVIVQRYIPADGSNLYIRFRLNNSWTSWKSVSLS